MITADDRFLSRMEVAVRYGIPVKTLAQWAHQDKGPKYTRIGRYARYRLADCIAWENAQRTGGAA